MRRILPGMVLVLALCASASAQRNPRPYKPSPHSHAAPEIDPGLAAGGLVLLLGGTLVLIARRRVATT